jgi:hypothetical protein
MASVLMSSMKPGLGATLVGLLAACASSTQPTPTVAASFSFDETKEGATEWAVAPVHDLQSLGDWQIRPDVGAVSPRHILCLRDPHHADGGVANLFWRADISLAEAEISVMVRLDALGAIAGVAWDVVSEKSFKAALIDDRSGRVRLVEMTGGVLTDRATGQLDDTGDSEWMHLSVTVARSGTECLVDGRRSASLTAPMTAGGGIGLVTLGASIASFDDLMISPK